MNALPLAAAVQRLVGWALPFGPDGEPSAIGKHPAVRPLRLTATGFEGDEQDAPRHHGGPDKAMHHYPGEHYAAWHLDLPERQAEQFRIGAFGKNPVPAFTFRSINM
ncbi:MAG: MOSC domain-containing protein [Thiobacillus sp.]|nr:MOSC domain-containing protein [Thiobacillus sp.]